MDEEDYGSNDIEFTEENARWITSAGASHFQRRKQRIRDEILFRDVVDVMEGTHDMVISCPFHGRDSRPSFYIYVAKNNGWCFGCPEGEQFYDSIIYVSKKLSITYTKAMDYLEKKYNLPPLEMSPEDVEEDYEEAETETETFTLTFENLQEAFIEHAGELFKSKDIDCGKTRTILRTYVEAKPAKGADPASPEELQKVAPLIRLLGKDRLQELTSKRALRYVHLTPHSRKYR